MAWDYPVDPGTSISRGWLGVGVHEGIDFECVVGTPVCASFDGTIVRTPDEEGGYGNLVEMGHFGDGTLTRFGHLSRIDVSAGQWVNQGQQVGLSGGLAGAPGSGGSTGPHLHFEIRPQGTPVDPAPLIAGNPGPGGTGSPSGDSPETPWVPAPGDREAADGPFYGEADPNAMGPGGPTGVIDVQNRLNELGFGTPINGRFDAGTLIAVRAYEQSRGLNADNYVTARMRSGLDAANGYPPDQPAVQPAPPVSPPPMETPVASPLTAPVEPPSVVTVPTVPPVPVPARKKPRPSFWQSFFAALSHLFRKKT